MPKKKEFNYSRDDLDRLIVDIFNGTVSPERLPVDLYNATFDRLLDGVFRGFGNTLDELNDGTPEKLLLEYYQHNIAIFSGAKTFQQVNDMSNAVFTPDGYKRSFSDFKKLITGDNFHNGIFAQYNVNYLQTEYNTAVRVAQMGRQFTEYYKDADLFPYLKYITVHDERVRDTHKYFDGVTLPVGHKFWDTHCPPNGFNCRCRVIQLSEFDDFTITPDADVKDLPDPDQPLFGMNPAKSGFVFDPSKHPYTVKIGERFAPASKVNFGLPTPPAPTIPITIPDLPKTSKYIPDQLSNFTKEEFNPEFFDLVGEKLEIIPAPDGVGSHYNPSNDKVYLRFGSYPTAYDQKRIIYHEFGHAIHFKNKWVDQNDSETIVHKYFNKSRKLDLIEELKLNKKFTKDPKAGISYEAIDYLDTIYSKYRHLKMHDFDQMMMSIADTLGALTDNEIGFGHETAYYKQGLNLRNKKVFNHAEFVAHAFENRFLGNEIFQNEFPDLYNLMNEMIDELIKLKKSQK